MEREYDLFEQIPGGQPMWRGHASGLRSVRVQLQEIAKATTNECFAIYLPTKEIVARVNVRASGNANGKPTVFQIAYDSRLATARTEVLRLYGCEVISAIGNEAAKVVLDLSQHCDLFIVGDSAPDEERMEMVAWLRAKYPGISILALNPPTVRELASADYNAKQNGPETWLPMVDNCLRLRAEFLRARSNS